LRKTATILTDTRLVSPIISPRGLKHFNVSAG